MIVKYKLTDQKGKTFNGFCWPKPVGNTPGKWVEATGDIKQGLCSDAWLHCYDHPLLAALYNPAHADIDNPLLWKAECAGKSKNDDGMKRGYRKMRLLKQISLPKITFTQRAAYSILCAMKLCKNKRFQKWATNWLNGKDRSVSSACTLFHSTVHRVASGVLYDVMYQSKSMVHTMDYIRRHKLNLLKIAEKAVKYT